MLSIETKNAIKRKLSSRKLWTGIVLVVIGTVLCATGDMENGMKLITLGGGAYIGAETIVDIARSVFGVPDAAEYNIEEEILEDEEG